MRDDVSQSCARRSAAMVVVVSALLLAMPRTAHADAAEFKRCEALSEGGQLARKAGRYLKAQNDFRECLQTSCPAVMQRDCDAWLREIEQQLPSLVVAVVRPDGTPLPAASLDVDGVLAQARLTGLPVVVDPGEHVITVRFGAESARREVFVMAGEKSRQVRIELLASPPADARRAVPATGRGGEPRAEPTPWAPVLLTAASVASFGAAAVVGLGARSDLAELEGASCATTRTCSPSELDSVRTRFLVTDVLIGVGAVALGAAIVTWLARPTALPPRAAVSVAGLRLAL